ncbi:response regulator [Neorhodopirellula pilleata]|uniref:histidine kinase n=1 Tax=Neorhodopirellula pilleata TaxID=2714738 RepID=A0A5C6AW02_9BACT|nr:response regulator [Neorhodopirellula pilleata]TWU03631.1 Signal transduction histidine-protein kinase BarA [Neorhodopirellula pilleata]
MFDLRAHAIPGMRPPHWWFAGIAVLMVVDMAAPPWWGLCVLHLLVLPIAWRFLHRRFITKVTASQAAAVAIAGTWHVFFGSHGNGWPMGLDRIADRSLFGHSIREFGEYVSTMAANSSANFSFDFVRLWTLLAILAAGYFHVYLRRRLRQRLEHQHFLQQNVRRRSREIERVNHALRDEVARRQATQHRLDQSETTFQSIMERMHLQVARKNAEGVFTYANEPFCRELGRAAIDVIGSTDADLYKPVVAARYRADDMKVMTTGQNIDKVEEHPGVDGQPGFVQVFKAPEYDQHGRCIGVQVIFWDITEKHRSEIALRHSEARKRALFDAAGDAVLLIDELGIIMEANPSATDMLHAGGGRLIGRPLEHLIMPIDDNSSIPIDGEQDHAEPSLIDQPLPGIRAFPTWSSLPLSRRHHLRLRRGDGVAFDSEVSMHIIPLGNQASSTGQLVSASSSGREREGRAVIIRDVTLQQQAFEAMRDAKAAAEQANRTKTQFMAGISHELRTPLGGIRGLTELLAQQTLPAPARRYVNLISQNTELLHDAIEDILDFSAIEAGRVAIAPATIDLHSIVGDAFGCLAIRVADKPVRLSLSIDPDVPRHVVADAKRIRQIIVNLVGNAIKFTAAGQVSLRLISAESHPDVNDAQTDQPDKRKRRGSSGEPAEIRKWFRLIVEDTGIGIAPENQARIFDAFEQADLGTNKQFGGTGLGLAIARGLAQRMGGGILVESEIGQGSRFIVDLNLPLADGVDPNADLRNSITAAHRLEAVVLSVDNETIEKALVETISDTGFRAFKPTSVSSQQGKSPVRWILTSATADTAFRVRARKSEDHVLWLTRAGEPAPRRAKKEDAVMIEPVHPDELRRWLAGMPLKQSGRGLKASQRRESRRSPKVSTRETANAIATSMGPPEEATAAMFADERDTANASARPNAIEVLVVDDSPTNRLVIHDQLLAAGHVVQTAHDGPDALRVYQRHLEGELHFDCVLMDLQMPKMDGTEVTAEIIRQSKQAGQVAPPIIALTAHVTDQHRQMCRDAGMVGYITKPIHLEPLLDEMRRVIDASSPVVGTQAGDESVSPVTGDDAWKSRLAKHCGNDESTMRSVCQAITIEIPELIGRLDTAGRSGNQRAFTTAAHTLKSCLRYVAETDDTQLASEVEKNSNDPEWINRLKDGLVKRSDAPEVRQLQQLQERAKQWVSRISS